jgi:peptidyl-prolyl cis-trans isomerase A (cyclophilin A)
MIILQCFKIAYFLGINFMQLKQLVTSLITRPLIGLLSLVFIAATPVQATIVQFETAFGNFEVNLYDQSTPETVANFLAYVKAGDFSGTVIHRSIPGFIIQGGGFAYQDSWPLNAIASNSAVTNEPKLSNVRGTIAMAKVGGNPNSATNQWFFNLANNSENLDRQNGGFTAFGQVMGNGMAIIDQIAALPRYNLSGALTDLPLQAYTAGNNPDNTNLIIINSIQVIDANANTAANLNPPANITIGESSSGSGALGWGLLILGLLIVNRIRS